MLPWYWSTAMVSNTIWIADQNAEKHALYHTYLNYCLCEPMEFLMFCTGTRDIAFMAWTCSSSLKSLLVPRWCSLAIAQVATCNSWYETIDICGNRLGMNSWDPLYSQMDLHEIYNCRQYDHQSVSHYHTNMKRLHYTMLRRIVFNCSHCLQKDHIISIELLPLSNHQMSERKCNRKWMLSMQEDHHG